MALASVDQYRQQLQSMFSEAANVSSDAESFHSASSEPPLTPPPIISTPKRSPSLVDVKARLEPVKDLRIKRNTPDRPGKPARLPECDRTQPPSQPTSPKKPKSLLRRISTKFRRSAKSPKAEPPLPLSSKENREAALRERGLLPPLPLPDLSVLEAEQDQQLPTSPTEENDEMMSAARRIKDAWRAKNDPQRTLLSTFRFGGSKTDLPATAEPAPLSETAEPAIPPKPLDLTDNMSVLDLACGTPLPLSRPSTPPTHLPLLTITTSPELSIPAQHDDKTPYTTPLPLSPLDEIPHAPSPPVRGRSQTLPPPSTPPAADISTFVPARSPSVPAPAERSAALTAPSLSSSASLTSISTEGAPQTPASPARKPGVPVIIESPIEEGVTSFHNFTEEPETIDEKINKLSELGDMVQPLSKITKRRSFLSSSFGTLKRSVSGISRPKIGSPAKPPAGSKLAPSSATSHPSPPSFGASRMQGGQLPPPRLRPVNEVIQRAPLSPTMHNRGSIMLGAADIEDDESRRLSEMAFLG